MRILGSVDEPDTGSVIIAGKKITGMKDKELSEFRRRNIGYIYQDYSLFPEFTAYENVVMPILIDGKKPDENEVDDLLEELGISHCKNKFPSQMSGGEQQRTAIARALINRPSILLCDEPTGNLDPTNSNEIMKILDAVNKQGTTVLVVTHNMEIVQQMKKRTITMSQGKIISDLEKGGYFYED